jgi:hypothetical protein
MLFGTSGRPESLSAVIVQLVNHGPHWPGLIESVLHWVRPCRPMISLFHSWAVCLCRAGPMTKMALAKMLSIFEGLLTMGNELTGRTLKREKNKLTLLKVQNIHICMNDCIL